MKSATEACLEAGIRIEEIWGVVQDDVVLGVFRDFCLRYIDSHETEKVSDIMVQNLGQVGEYRTALEKCGILKQFEKAYKPPSAEKRDELMKALRRVQAKPLSTAAIEALKMKGYGPLHIAAMVGDADAVYLLAHADGADVEALTEDGCSALFLATTHGKQDAAAALMTTSPAILPSMREAARKGEIAMLRQFLPFGRNHIDLVLLDAIAGGHSETIQFLLEVKEGSGAGLEKRNEQKFTLLGAAAMKGNLQEVETFLKAGADPFTPCGPDKLTSMHLAAQYGHTDVVRRLSQIPGLVNHKTKARLLRFVPESAAEKLKKECQSSGITLDLSQTDITPLYVAAEGGHLECVEALLKAGARVNETCGPFYHTALFGAIRGKKTQVFEKLCQVPGIDIDHETLDGRTPIIVVIMENDPKMLDIIIRAGAKLNIRKGPKKFGPLLLTIQSNKPDMTLRLLQEGRRIDKNIKDNEGFTPLLLAVDANSLQSVDALLKEGADPARVYGPMKRTVLHVAAERSSLEIVQRLCADTRTTIHRRDDKGNSPLELAEEAKRKDIVAYLVSKGAKKSPALPYVIQGRLLINKGKWMEAKKTLKNGQKVDAGYFNIPFLLGRIAYHEKQYQEAEGHLKEALKLWEMEIGPSYIPDSDSLTYSIYANLADVAFKQHKYPDALPYYSKIAELKPKDPECLLKLCYCFYMLGEYQEAEAIIRKALPLDPDNSYAWHLLGQALFMQKRFEAARQSFDVALKKNPKNAEAYASLAHIEVLNKKFEDERNM